VVVSNKGEPTAYEIPLDLVDLESIRMEPLVGWSEDWLPVWVLAMDGKLYPMDDFVAKGTQA
jgi:hypothetical protein